MKSSTSFITRSCSQRQRPATLKRLSGLALAASLAACTNLPTAGSSSMPAPMSAPVAVSAASPAAAGKVTVQWLGQSAFKITSASGKVIVVDPYLTANPKTPPAYKNLAALGKVDLILVTHAHTDHMLDAPALSKMNNAPVWGPAGLSQSMQTLGVLPAPLANRMNKGGSILPFGPGGVRITMTRAEHSSELVWRNEATGKDETHVGGEPAGFVIEMENGFRIWHMGDTGVFGDMRLLGEMYKPDLLLVPIGGGPFVMNPADAAMATRDLVKPRMAIPMHYGTNPQLAGTPAQFVDALGTASPVKVLAVQPGEALAF
jgi:L-ascorbate metabolism protein UlaG (beta-lactamase superfamily)